MMAGPSLTPGARRLSAKLGIKLGQRGGGTKHNFGVYFLKALSKNKWRFELIGVVHFRFVLTRWDFRLMYCTDGWNAVAGRGILRLSPG